MAGSTRRLRRAASASAALFCGLLLVGVTAPGAVASSPSELARRVRALERSAAGASAQRRYERVVTSPAVGHLSRRLMRQYGAQLTSFQTSLLELNVLLTGPKVRAAFRSLRGRHRPSPAQRRRLRGVLSALRRNPAIALLNRKGRKLKRHPARLAAALAAINAAPAGAPSAPAPGRDPATSEIALALSRVAIPRYDARMRQILSDPGASRYIATLPPLIVASLIPPDQVLSYALPPRRGHAAEILSPETIADLQLATHLALSDVTQRATDLVEHAVKLGAEATTVAEALAVLGIAAGLPVGAAVTLAGTAAAAGAYLTVKEVADLIQKITDVVELHDPAALRLTPDWESITPLVQAEYSAEALDASGKSLGPVSFTLTITDGPPCIGHICTATKVGDHTVTARDGSATGQATLHVDPGALNSLVLSPEVAQVKVGEAQHYTVEGQDAWHNDTGPVAIGTAPGEAQLSMEPDGPCSADSCTPKTPGPHTVIAVDGSFIGRAELTVRGDGTLAVSPSLLEPGIPGAYYRQAFQATGGTGPLTWSSVGSLPPGLRLNAATGVLEGVPTTLGVSGFTIGAADDAGDAGVVDTSLTIEPPACSGSPCAVAAGNHQVSVAWAPCGCLLYPAGPYAYFLGAYINGVKAPLGNPFDLVLYFGAGSAPLYSGPGGRTWYTYGNGLGFTQTTGDDMFFVLSYGRAYVNPPGLVSLGTTSTVLVK